MRGNYELKLSYTKLFYQDLWILREQWLLCTYLDLKIKHIKAYLSTSFASGVFGTTADSRKAWELHWELLGIALRQLWQSHLRKDQTFKYAEVLWFPCTRVHKQSENWLIALEKKSLPSVVLYKTSEEIIQDSKILIISPGTAEEGKLPLLLHKHAYWKTVICVFKVLCHILEVTVDL